MFHFPFRKKSRYQFRQDKPHVSLWSRFHLTNQQKKSLLHWGLYGVMMLVLSVLQDVLLCRIRVLGAAPDPLACFIILIGMLEGVEAGGMFALCASFLYLFSGSAPGVYACTFLTVLSIVASAFRQTYLQKGFRSVVVCMLPAMALYEACVFFMGIFLQRTVFARFGGFMITAGLSCVLLPVMYPIAVAIGKIGGSPWKD